MCIPPCQKCESDRIFQFCAKSSDLNTFNYKYGESKDGYLPYIDKICGGDYVRMKVCLECGQVQGKFPVEYPKDEEEIDEDELEDPEDKVDYMVYKIYESHFDKHNLINCTEEITDPIKQQLLMPYILDNLPDNAYYEFNQKEDNSYNPLMGTIKFKTLEQGKQFYIDIGLI